MESVLASVVTYDDLSAYFRGAHWKVDDSQEGKFNAKSEAYDVQLEKQKPQFRVEIEAVDDPSDSETKVVENPTEYIAKFLSTGTEADNYLKKMSFDGAHRLLAAVLRRVAGLVESGSISGRQAARAVRRGVVMLDGPRVRDFIAAVVMAADPWRSTRGWSLTKLRKEMEGKGWKVTQGEDDREMPMLIVDVSGIYRAKISLESVMWKYSYMVHDAPDSKDEGVTDDPISAFRQFYKKDSTSEAKQALRDKKQQKQEEGTAPAAPVGRERKKEKEKGGTEDTLFAPTELPPSSGTKGVTKGNKYSDED